MADGARSNFHGTQWTCAELAAVMPITEGVSWSCSRPTWVPGASSWSARQRDTEAAEPGFCRRRVAASAPSERAGERARASRPWRGPPMVTRCWMSDRSRRMRPARSSAWFHGRDAEVRRPDRTGPDPRRPDPTRPDTIRLGAARRRAAPRRPGRGFIYDAAASRTPRAFGSIGHESPPRYQKPIRPRGLTVLLLPSFLTFSPLSFFLPVSVRPLWIDRPVTRGIARVEKRRSPRESEEDRQLDAGMRCIRKRYTARTTPNGVAALSPSAARVSAPDCVLMRYRSYDRVAAFPYVELCNVTSRGRWRRTAWQVAIYLASTDARCLPRTLPQRPRRCSKPSRLSSSQLRSKAFRSQIYASIRDSPRTYVWS